MPISAITAMARPLVPRRDAAGFLSTASVRARAGRLSLAATPLIMAVTLSAVQLFTATTMIAAAQQQRPDRALGRGIAQVGAAPVARLQFGALPGGQDILVEYGLGHGVTHGWARLDLQHSCTIPHEIHRRTTRNRRTPGIPQPSRSLQRFVDFPTQRHAKPDPPGSLDQVRRPGVVLTPGLLTCGSGDRI